MRFALGAAAILSVLNCLSACAEESIGRRSPDETTKSITAILHDGRHVSGFVAETTNGDQLDLIVASERVQLIAHLNWAQVAAIDTGDGQLPVEQVRRQLSEFTQHSGTPKLLDRQLRQAGSLIESDSSEPRTLPHQIPRSVELDARLASWDQDAEPDGLLLELYVLDGMGRPMVASGQLTATLTGLRQSITGGQNTRGRKPPTVQIGKWNTVVQAGDFTDGRVVVELPFRHIQPDRDLSIATESLLTISFGVSSVGVFKASQPDVLIRHPSFFRDELFLSTGNRRLPSEGAIPHPERPSSGGPYREIFRPTFRVR